MADLIHFCCPNLSSWASLGFLDFSHFSGFALHPCFLVLACPHCAYSTAYSVVYRFPGCIAAFLHDLPTELQETEDVSEVLSLLQTEGERNVLFSLAIRGNRTAMMRIVSAYLGDSMQASDCYMSETEAFYISSLGS